MEKHKEQLKMLFFNPGMRIPGIPLMGNKAAVFDDELAPYYHFSIDVQDRKGHPCYVFSVKAKTKEEIKKYNEERKKIYELKYKRSQECWNMIWDKMKKSNGWWD
jgi:hypothetical protein